ASHADNIEPVAPIEFRFGPSGKRRAIHVHVSAAVMNGGAALLLRFRQQLAEFRRDRVGKGNVGGNAFPEKSVAGAQTCPVKKLRRQEDIAWRVFFLQTAGRRNANNPADVEGTERVNIRPMIQFMRQNPVPSSMSRQKTNAATTHCAADDPVGGRAEGRVDFVFGQVGKAFQVIETAAAYNPDSWLIHMRD